MGIRSECKNICKCVYALLAEHLEQMHKFWVRQFLIEIDFLIIITELHLKIYSAYCQVSIHSVNFNYYFFSVMTHKNKKISNLESRTIFSSAVKLQFHSKSTNFSGKSKYGNISVWSKIAFGKCRSYHIKYKDERRDLSKPSFCGNLKIAKNKKSFKDGKFWSHLWMK